MKATLTISLVILATVIMGFESDARPTPRTTPSAKTDANKPPPYRSPLSIAVSPDGRKLLETVQLISCRP